MAALNNNLSETNDHYSAFQCVGSRHIHKEIKLLKTMKGMDRIMCETDLYLIRRHTYMCNIFSDVDSEALSMSAYVPLWYSHFQ